MSDDDQPGAQRPPADPTPRGSSQRFVAVVAAIASIAGGVVTGSASYLATQSSNHAIIQRQERNDFLAARSAARLVDTELAQVAVRLQSLQKQYGIDSSWSRARLRSFLRRRHKAGSSPTGAQSKSLLQRLHRVESSSLAAALHNLPHREWDANQQVLARTLNAHDWGAVSFVYEQINASASERRILVIPSIPLGLLEHEVRAARDALLRYE